MCFRSSNGASLGPRRQRKPCDQECAQEHEVNPGAVAHWPFSSALVVIGFRSAAGDEIVFVSPSLSVYVMVRFPEGSALAEMLRIGLLLTARRTYGEAEMNERRKKRPAI